jgi:hypothetical protein
MKTEMTKIKKVRDRPMRVPMKKPPRAAGGGPPSQRLCGTNHSRSNSNSF